MRCVQLEGRVLTTTCGRNSGGQKTWLPRHKTSRRDSFAAESEVTESTEDPCPASESGTCHLRLGLSCIGWGLLEDYLLGQLNR